MAGSSFGKVFRITTFGESHGPAMGVVIDGCPAGVTWDGELLEAELARRRPGRTAIDSARAEMDEPHVLSGVFEGRTLGTPIAVIVHNKDARSADYEDIKAAPRQGHADDVWVVKFGHADHRGGGRSSGRETLSRVIGGAVAQMVIGAISPGTVVLGFARQIGPIALDDDELAGVERFLGTDDLDELTARFPHDDKAQDIERLLTEAKDTGTSYGGVAEVWVEAPPAGLGQPVFDKLKADLAKAALSIGATTAFELGAGFGATAAEGSEFHRRTDQGGYGGVRGGISTGERIVFRVHFKPTSSVLDTARKGRHDPCIVPRAIPVLEAMTRLVLADHILAARADTP
jgi:chorismate synthase